MAGTAVETQGTKLKVGQGDGPPETFVAASNITGISGPDGTAAEIDVTDFDSIAKEFKMALPDEGNITLSGNWIHNDAQQLRLESQRKARAVTNFEIELSGAVATISFAAFVVAFNLDAQPDDVWKLSATLRLTGPITIT